VKDPWATEKYDFLVSFAEYSLAFWVNVGGVSGGVCLARINILN